MRFKAISGATPGPYTIAVTGSDGGFTQKTTTIPYTLKIGPLTLTAYTSPAMNTDPHQRPDVQFSWFPPVPFVDIPVTFDASPSAVYVVGTGMTPVTAVNMSSDCSDGIRSH